MPQTIIIQGQRFTIPSPYAAGPADLTVSEAEAFNQLYADNIQSAIAKRKTLPSQRELDEYCASYTLGSRSAARVRDKITREMRDLARDAIQRAYYARHGEKLEKDECELAIDRLLEQRHEEYLERAKANIERREALAKETLEEAI